MQRTYQATVEALAELETFDPEAFVGNELASEEVCDLIVSFALVFNDFKDLLAASSLLNPHAPKDGDAVTRERGAFQGAHLQIIRTLVGRIYELVFLIRNNREVFEQAIFVKLARQLPVEARETWTKLLAIVDNGESNDPDVLVLLKARNTVGFHYDRKSIGRAYRRSFAEGGEQPYLSRGGSLAQSRFYFADRAAQVHLQQVFGSEVERFFIDRPTFLSHIAVTLYEIVTRFVTLRGYGWREPAS